ncbi:zinc finger protein 704-like [Anguilla anguilla]|uniref:zinc finger protein 704-like n=1 Tax=Anguilla anguilla TaxID=7936 RepID=UPI0015A98AAC|nr:zinc finger protein 704-like [Anguilla anguilla]
MNSEGLLNKSLKVGISSCTTVHGLAGNGGLHAGARKENCEFVATVDSHKLQSAASTGRFLCALFLDDGGAVKEYRSDDSAVSGTVLTKEGKEKRPNEAPREDRDVQERRCDVLPRDTEPRGQPPPGRALHPCASSQILVPTHRAAKGHADREVMAAAALTSLSATNPLVLPQNTVPETTSKGLKESLSGSYGSTTSGNWSWDASDQSVPSTPSPPLWTDINKTSLLLSQGDDLIDESEITHFLFEDPIPRKRKNSMKVMFKCLWKNCETVLSSSSGIQRHVRTFHLGRNGDSEDSDGEEDFYYSEMEVNVDTLSEGLSCLTPASPTAPMAPPTFYKALPIFSCPHPSQRALISLRAELGCTSPLSQSAPSTLCQIRTDHTYQATAALSIPGAPSAFRPNDASASLSWQPLRTTPPTQICNFNVMERRLPFQHTTFAKPLPPAVPTAKTSTGSRKSRGEAKKCRKVYGMEKKDLWCTACRWKKACQRFTD